MPAVRTGQRLPVGLCVSVFGDAFNLSSIRSAAGPRCGPQVRCEPEWMLPGPGLGTSVTVPVHRLWHRRLQLLQQRRVPVGDFGREALPTERYSALVALDLEGPSQEKL